MTATPPIVDRETWQEQIEALRVREKAHTREGDAIAAPASVSEYAARCPRVASSRVSRPAATSRLSRLLRMLDAIPSSSPGAARGSGAGCRRSRRAARASTTGRRAPRWRH
jgi:hypothetical protein